MEDANNELLAPAPALDPTSFIQLKLDLPKEDSSPTPANHLESRRNQTHQQAQAQRREEKARKNLLDVSTIYLEEAVPKYPRGQEILARFPAAKLIEVKSHWNIPELNQSEKNAPDWNKVKRNNLVLGIKKGLQIVSYYRSTDFIAPSQANGCAMACAYCYVARRKGFANPITTFVNIEQICSTLKKHVELQGTKKAPSQADPAYWVYELGTNSDCSVDAIICNNVKDSNYSGRNRRQEGLTSKSLPKSK